MTDEIASAYEAAARMAMNAERDSSMTIELRRANNFVKDGPIRVCISFWANVLRDAPESRPRLEVLDLCCGRGQDFDKFRRAARDGRAVLSKLVGVDLSGGDTAASARERWLQSAEWVLRDNEEHAARGNSTVMMGGVLTADLSSSHAAQAIDRATEASCWDGDSIPRPGAFHMVTCFFALHYFFRSADALANLMAGVSWYLRDGGFFAAIHADGEMIARRARESGEAAESSAELLFGQAKVRLSERTREMLRCKDADDFKDDSSSFGDPFGWDYAFELPGAVLNVREYLVHSPTRDRHAENVHLIKVLDEPASILLHRMTLVPFWAEAFEKCQVDCTGNGFVTAATEDALSLYRVVIYGKYPLGCDIISARKFIRAKLGLSE